MFWPSLPPLGEFPPDHALPKEFIDSRALLQSHRQEIREEVLKGLRLELAGGFAEFGVTWLM